MRSDLDKGDLAGAGVTLCVSDDHLTIVLQPALLTQHVVDTCHCLVPFIVITIPTHTIDAIIFRCILKLVFLGFRFKNPAELGSSLPHTFL